MSLDDENENTDVIPEELRVMSSTADYIDRSSLLREVEHFVTENFDEQRQHILAMHLAGKSAEEIARKF